MKAFFLKVALKVYFKGKTRTLKTVKSEKIPFRLLTRGGNSMKRLSAALMVLILTVSAIMILPDGKGAPIDTRDAGRILYVAPENSTYPEIEFALGEAMDGDTIYVAPGTYEFGMLILTSGITVIGNNTEGDVIVGSAADAIAGIHAPWVNISGFIFTDDNPHMGIMSMSNADNSSISDVEFIAKEDTEGLNIRDSRNVVFRNITIRTNDRQAMRIIRSQNISIEDMDLSCNTSMGGCLELDNVDDLGIDDGSIELRGGGTAIYNLAGGNLNLTHVTADYTEKFIMMETGNVTMYNMIIDPADILMDVPDPIHTVSSYFRKYVLVTGEGPDGGMIPLEGAELNATTDGMNIYSTGYFGGSDPTSDIDGYFSGMTLTFLSWEKVGGGSGYRNGTNRIEVRFEGDYVGEYLEEQVGANTSHTLVIQIMNIFNQVRMFEGIVSTLDVPVHSLPIANASVLILDNNQTVIANTTTDESGFFRFWEIPMGVNFTLRVVPPNPVEEGGEESGYLIFESWVNLTESDEVVILLQYYEYNSAPIFGYVRYKDGPKEGEFVELAEVRLFNQTGVEMGVAITKWGGLYGFQDIPFGEIYELRITPPLHELGVNLEITGYLPWDYGFYHNRSISINASLKYYEHMEPAPPHPEVTILDDEGNPVEGAQVEVTIEGATYTAKTNMFGTAVFQSLEMEDFPAEAEFTVSKEGYDDIEWKQGEEIPAIKESKTEEPIWLLVLMVIVVLLVLAIAAYLIFLRKGPGEEIEE